MTEWISNILIIVGIAVAYHFFQNITSLLWGIGQSIKRSNELAEMKLKKIEWLCDEWERTK
jgi:hypothetical protein